MSNILVTGAGGYLGSYTSSFFANLGYVVFGTYRSNKVLDKRVNFQKVELSDEKQVEQCFKNIQPGLVIHCASIADIDFCEKNKEICLQSNVRSTEVLSKFCRQFRIPFVLISSEAVFDGNSKLKYTENDNTNPLIYYGQTKVEAEKVIQKSKCTFLIVRAARIVGSSEHGTRRQYDKILQDLENGKDVFLDSQRLFTPTWNFHLCNVILWWVKQYRKNLLCNVAVPEVTTFYNLMSNAFLNTKIEKLLKTKPLDNYKVARPKDTPLNTKLLKSLGAPMYDLNSLEENLKKELGVHI